MGWDAYAIVLVSVCIYTQTWPTENRNEWLQLKQPKMSMSRILIKDFTAQLFLRYISQA